MTIYENQEAEQIILGTAIMNNSLLLNVADILESKHFSYIEHQEICFNSKISATFNNKLLFIIAVPNITCSAS